MLQAIRSHTSGIVVQALFGLLILTFALWGIGDIFRGRGSDTSVAKVGGQEIPASEVSQALHITLDRIQRSTNTSLTPDQIKELGILDTTVRDVINQHLLDLEASRLGLAVNDEAVRQAILSNPAFRGPSGVFDRNTYLALLNANQMTDQQYESMLRQSLVRNRLVDSVTAGAAAPTDLVNALWQARGQRRVATALILPTQAVGDIGAPTDVQLEKYYKSHQSEYMLPTRRSFTVAFVDPGADLAAITIPEDQVQAAYEKRKGEFRIPERRALQQILVTDETKAKAAEAALAKGDDFAKVAAAVAGEKPDTIALGTLTERDLPGALGKAVFDLKAGGVTKPIHDPFGWHIIKVVQIEPPTVEPLAQARAKLVKQLRLDKAAEEAAKLANSIDDATAGGATFQDVVTRFKLKEVTVTGVDAQGHDASGKATKVPAPAEQILKTAFATSPSQPSDLKNLPDQGYYMVKVDAVIPAAPQPLAQVRDKVAKAWQESQREARLQKMAQDIANAVDKGQQLADVAALHGLKTFTTQPFSRDTANSGLPPDVMAKLFGAKLGQAVSGAAQTANGDVGAIVAALTQILPPDPAQAATAKKTIRADIVGTTKSDLLSEFEQALRQRYPVSVNHQALSNLL
jgi:peptidyl-prolyl cis-trans isomerase D